MSTTTVSISELNNHLSAYLREAEAGATIVITRRGTPVGRIVPPENGDAATGAANDEPSPEDIERRMQAMEDEGLLRWSGKKPPYREPVATVRGNKTVAQMLLEDRR
jgi:prevent-host-death family protein